MVSVLSFVLGAFGASAQHTGADADHRRDRPLRHEYPGDTCRAEPAVRRVAEQLRNVGAYQQGVRERVGAVDRYHVCAVELADRDTRFPLVFGASVLPRSGNVNFAPRRSQRVLELRAVDPTALAAGGSHLDPVRPLPQQLDRHAALHRDSDREAAARTGVEIDVRVFDHDFNRCPRVCRRDGQHSQQEATNGQGSKHGLNLRVPGTDGSNIVH